MKFFEVHFILCSCLLLASCNYSIQKKSPENLNEVQKDQLSSNFESVHSAIFQPKCIRCHQQYDSYFAVYLELSAIKDAVASGRMPKSGEALSDSEKEILFAWINEGAPNSAADVPGSALPVKLEPNWKFLSENIFVPKCLVCHNPQGQAKFLDLSSRHLVFESRNRIFANGSKLIDFDNSEKSYLLEILLDDEEPMPPIWSKISRVKLEEAAVIQEWIRLGIP